MWTAADSAYFEGKPPKWFEDILLILENYGFKHPKMSTFEEWYEHALFGEVKWVEGYSPSHSTIDFGWWGGFGAQKIKKDPTSGVYLPSDGSSTPEYRKRAEKLANLYPGAAFPPFFPYSSNQTKTPEGPPLGSSWTFGNSAIGLPKDAGGFGSSGAYGQRLVPRTNILRLGGC